MVLFSVSSENPLASQPKRRRTAISNPSVNVRVEKLTTIVPTITVAEPADLETNVETGVENPVETTTDMSRAQFFEVLAKFAQPIRPDQGKS